MNMLASIRGLAVACLLLSLQACTHKQDLKPIPLRADQPVVVTKVEYQPIPPSLLPSIDAAWGFTRVWVEGDMYGALAHDSGQLDTCKAALDGIRGLTANPPPGRAPGPQPAARAPGQ